MKKRFYKLAACHWFRYATGFAGFEILVVFKQAKKYL